MPLDSPGFRLPNRWQNNSTDGRMALAPLGGANLAADAAGRLSSLAAFPWCKCVVRATRSFRYSTTRLARAIPTRCGAAILWRISRSRRSAAHGRRQAGRRPGSRQARPRRDRHVVRGEVRHRHSEPCRDQAADRGRGGPLRRSAGRPDRGPPRSCLPSRPPARSPAPSTLVPGGVARVPQARPAVQRHPRRLPKNVVDRVIRLGDDVRLRVALARSARLRLPPDLVRHPLHDHDRRQVRVGPHDASSAPWVGAPRGRLMKAPTLRLGW